MPTNDTHSVSSSPGQVLFQPWTAEICIVLARERVLRFTEIKRRLPGISSRTLAARLAALRRSRVVERKLYDETPLRIEYELSDRGVRLAEQLLPLVSHWEAGGEEDAPARPPG